jgi:hypothetical protein
MLNARWEEDRHSTGSHHELPDGPSRAERPRCRDPGRTIHRPAARLSTRGRVRRAKSAATRTERRRAPEGSRECVWVADRSLALECRQGRAREESNRDARVPCPAPRPCSRRQFVTGDRQRKESRRAVRRGSGSPVFQADAGRYPVTPASMSRRAKGGLTRDVGRESSVTPTAIRQPPHETHVDGDSAAPSTAPHEGDSSPRCSASHSRNADPGGTERSALERAGSIRFLVSEAYDLRRQLTKKAGRQTPWGRPGP